MQNALKLTQAVADSPPERGFQIRIGGDELAPRQARRHVAGLRPQLNGAALDTTQLLVTELITNSVRHARAQAVELAVSVDPARVRVEVANPGAPFTPAPREEAQGPDPGWGLFLVDELSDAWGVDGDSNRQRVWFELARA